MLFQFHRISLTSCCLPPLLITAHVSAFTNFAIQMDSYSYSSILPDCVMLHRSLFAPSHYPSGIICSLLFIYCGVYIYVRSKPVTCRKHQKLSYSYAHEEKRKMWSLINLVQKLFECDNLVHSYARLNIIIDIKNANANNPRSKCL